MIPTLETERMWGRPVQVEDAKQVQRIFPRWASKRSPMHADFVTGQHGWKKSISQDTPGIGPARPPSR
jgi:hypothetical protein